jgi:uncharacterized protein (TIGR00661 family)
MHKNKTILVAPLNWGLGHATRCIPLIRLLLQEGFEVLLGSDGNALTLLRQEFPELQSLTLPSYQIEYPKKAANFKWKMLLRSPKIIKAINAEQKMVKNLVKSNTIHGVISDNRFGLYHTAIPTVFITHQLQVLSGKTTKLTSALHRRYIKRYDACWVPDFKDLGNLSGKLGHPKNFAIPVIYIGPLSRLNTLEIPMVYDILVLLSGPEPQRTELEEILLHELRIYKGKVLFVRGKIDAEKPVKAPDHIRIVDFMESDALEKAINASKLILCRSGYTTIMDLAKLGKKAFFIPTPGQTEQEYLAKRLKKLRKVPFANQDEFRIKDLSQVEVYCGFDASVYASVIDDLDQGQLFSLFKGERKLRSHTKIAFYINLLVVGLYNMFHNR